MLNMFTDSEELFQPPKTSTPTKRAKVSKKGRSHNIYLLARFRVWCNQPHMCTNHTDRMPPVAIAHGEPLLLYNLLYCSRECMPSYYERKDVHRTHGVCTTYPLNILLIFYSVTGRNLYIPRKDVGVGLCMFNFLLYTTLALLA